MNNRDCQIDHVKFDSRTTEVVVRKKSKRSINGYFSAISVLSNKAREGRGMEPDVFDLLDKVSKGAFSVFNNLKYNRNEENNVTHYISTEEMNKTDREVLSRKLSELKKIGLIARMKKEVRVSSIPGGYYTYNDPRKVFIINPYYIKCKNYNEADEIWNQCV